MPFSRLRKLPAIPSLMESFYQERYRISSDAFFFLYLWDNHFLLYSFNMINDIDFSNVKQYLYS